MSGYRPGSPLREKSPLYRKPNDQQHAPLRRSPERQKYNEEDEYDRRRQEELRKQINTSKPTDQQLLRSNGFSSQQSKYLTQDQFYSVAERDNSKPSGTHFTLGPQSVQVIQPDNEYAPISINRESVRAQRELVNDSFGGEIGGNVRGNIPNNIGIGLSSTASLPPPHVKEHISNIQSDNQSLMRRLNLVIQELERVNREKDELYARLKLSAKDSSELQRVLNGEENIDKVNKYMQDDLAYERDRNLKVKSQIKDLDLYKQDLIMQLRRLQEQQEDISNDNRELSQSLQQNLSKIQDIEKENYFTQEKIKQLTRAIENLKADLIDDNSDKTGLQRILNQLIQERADLLSKLDLLAKKYDECVREITHDRQQMEQHNKQHAKLITAKIIFQNLESLQLNRKAVGFSEIRNYCNFDNKCNQKLKNLAFLLEKTANQRIRKALKTWHTNGLKSIGIRAQSEQLSYNLSAINFKQKAFYKWRKAYQARIDLYDRKTRAIQQIWHLTNKDSKVEVKRAFAIWKETLDRQRLQRVKVRKLVWRMYFNKISMAMNTWANHTSNIDSQVRLHLLSKEFSQKQYMTILFNNFKSQSYQLKSKRQNILFHCLKYWKDYLRYQKFIMAGNVLALRFRRNCDTSIVKQCFDAFKQHKEDEKFARAYDLLNNVELPMIDELTVLNEDIEVNSRFKAKSRACEAVKKCMAKSLQGYFSHWKNINEQFKEKLRTSLKDRIIKAYMETIRKSFTAWKTVNDGGKIEQQEMVVQEFQSEAQALTNEVISLQKEVQGQQEQRDCSQRKSTLKCVQSYERRLKQLAVGRWRDQVSSLAVKEDGAGVIIKRLRLRFLRKAFDMYRDAVKDKRQDMINDERMKTYQRTLAERTKRQVFQAWLQFRSNHSRAKNYWYRIYLRLDLGLKQQALKKWRQFSQKTIERELEEKGQEIVNTIDELNHQIGEHHIEETQQKLEIKDQQDLMTTQARRIISNAFARYYYVNETRGFEKWKEVVQFEKQKERLLKKIGDRLRKNQFYMLKSALLNWIQNSKINERKEELKREEMKVNDTVFQLDLQTKTYNANYDQLNIEQDEAVRQQKIYGDRLQKSVQMIMKKVQDNHFTSQKRYILLVWRQYVKREVNFIKCIQNVIQKSLWNKAFTDIRNYSRQQRDDRIKSTVLEQFRLKFWKRTCGNAFSNWKSGAFAIVSSNIQEVDQDTDQTINDYQQKKALFKDVNATRALRVIGKHNLRNLFQSWKNVKDHLKLYNAKTREFQSQSDLFNKKCTIRKWLRRKNATKQAKLKVKKLTKSYNNLRLVTYFNAMKTQYQSKKNFCNRLSNLAHIHNQHALKLSVNAIISFAKAKQFAHQQRKINASASIEQLLSGLLERKMRAHLHDLRTRAINKKKQEQSKGIAVINNFLNRVRYHFQQWRNQANIKTLAKEMHEEGPRREEIFEDRILLFNTKELLAKEGYDEREVEQGLKDELNRQSQLMLKGVRRIQHYNQQLYYKPKAFDRWRMFVHMRKLYRHYLNFAAKRSEFIKSDLHHAFDKWRNYYPTNYEKLAKLKKWQLDRRIMRNGTKLDNLADNIEDRENQIDSLNKHRDVLIENYIKGQKLAISLFVNHRRKGLSEAFHKWQRQIGQERSNSRLGQLRSNIELIEQLKNRIAQLEMDNDQVSNENEELRQFSLDGFELAKNVQTLTGEREKLSVDLADKAQVIRKLLDENEKLTGKLRFAQDEAQKLIRSTMSGSTAFKTGFKSSVNYT